MSKVYSVLGNKKALAITIVLILAIVGLIGAASADNLEPGQVAASKAAQAYTNGSISGYDVGINIISAGFEEHQATGKKDVILVLDISTSMLNDMNDNPTNDVSARRITAAKAAANSFVDLLFAEDAADNRMAIVTFGQTASIVPIGGSSNFSNNPAQIKAAINGIVVPSNNGTNPQAGFVRARSLVNQARADADAAVIVLSDGQPTYSLSNSYWNNVGNTFYRSDRNIETNLGTTVTGTGYSYHKRHTDRTIMEANKLRALGAEIYTIAFTHLTGDERNKINATMGSGYSGGSYKFNDESTITYSYNFWTYRLAPPYTAQFARSNGTTDGYLITGFNDFKVGYAKMAVGAGNAEELDDVFRTFAEAITKDIVATDAVLVDKIPEYFEVVLSSLPSYANYDPASRTITFNVGNIEGNKTISYKVVPVPGYNGLGYTNANTALTFNPVENNPYYDVPTASIDILDVSNREDKGELNSAFAGDGDVYHDADRNAPFVVTAADSILANDTTKTLHYVKRSAAEGYELVENSNGIYIKRNVAAQAHLATGPQYGSVVLNADGSFTYTYDLAANPYNHDITSDSFYYYLADADNLAATKSQPIKVTINLKELVDVSVHYLQNTDGNPAIADITPNPQLIIKQVGDKVSYVNDLLSPDTIYGGGDSQKPWLYNSSNPDLKAGDYTVLAKDGATNPNSLNIYYDKGFDLSIDIEHYRESGENPLSYTNFETDTITDGVVGQVINYASKTYNGYEFMPSLTDLNGNAVSDGQPIFSLDNKTIKLYYNALPLTTTIVHYDVSGKTANADGSYTVTSDDKMSVADITVNGKIYQTFDPEDYINQNISNRTYKGFFGLGVFTTEGHVIHAYYERIAVNATVRYVEKVGTEYVNLDASKNFNINGYLGDLYDASQINLLTFPGFSHSQTIVPNGGPFATNPGQDILVVYTRVPASVVVEYKDIANPDGGNLHSVVLPISEDGKFGDKVTISTDDITVDGILYVYNSIKEHGYAKPVGVDTELYLAQNPDGTYRQEDERVIVWMETVPAEITVHFYEVGKTVDLITAGKLEGVVGGSYATALATYEATEITGFTYSDTENASEGKVFVTAADGDIIIRYTRNSANISWSHKYIDVDGTDVDDDKNGTQEGLYQSSVNINKLSGGGYQYVGYSVNSYANSHLVSQSASALNAQYGTADYDVTLWYTTTAGPEDGTINVEYREEGDGGQLIKTIPHSGAYSYQREVSRVQIGEEEILDDEENVIGTIPIFDIVYETVPAETFAKSAATDSSVADIPGFTPTDSVTLGTGDCPDYVDYTETTQTVIVWYTRDNASITLVFEGDKGNGVIVPLGSDTLNGKFDETYDTTDKIPAEITKNGVRYTGGALPSPAPFGGKFPAGDDNVITIRYQMVPYVTIPIKHYVVGTTKTVYPLPPAPSSITGQVGSSLNLGSHPTVLFYNPSGNVVNPYGQTFPAKVNKSKPIIYYYEGKPYSVNVKYVEFMGFLTLPESLNGKYGFNNYSITQPYGTPYTVNKPTAEGFSYRHTIDLNGGVMGAANADVYVFYNRKADCKVTVKYYDVTNGRKKLMGSTTISGGKFDYPFSSVSSYSPALDKSFTNYVKVGESENSNGKFAVRSSVVEVYYEKATINMQLNFFEKGKYNNPIGAPLQSPYLFSGYYGSVYRLGNDVSWEIEGFKRVVPAKLPLTGVFKENDKQLNALYTRVDCTIGLLFKDVDTKEEIGDPTSITGPFGKSYIKDLNNGVKSFSKEGYKLVRVVDLNKTGKLYDLTERMKDITAWYQRMSSSVNIYYKQFGTEGEIKDMVEISGKYGDEYTVDTANFGRYRFHSIVNPNTEDNAIAGSLGVEMGDIIVYYTRIFGGGDPDPGPGPQPQPQPQPEPEIELEEEEEVPYGPVIPEPEEEVIVEAEEEEVPQGAIPAAGGTLTYLLAALGVAIVIAGGVLLKKARSQK